MGKKGSWFSAIKRVFTHSSKEKVADETEKKSSRERKKKGLGKLKHGDGHSFLPLFREPSSIEKILGEAEREHQLANYRPLTPPEQPKVAPPRVTPPPVRTATPPRATASPRAPTPPRAASSPRDVTQPVPRRTSSPQRVASPPRASTPVNAVTSVRAPSPRYVQRWRPQVNLRDQHICATKIQAAYRGYMARRSYRALRGLVRLQGVVKGHSVKRQTANALKCMQTLVRVQTQIQSRRIQMLENQALQRQALYKSEKDLESSFGKWLAENQDEWDDSTLTKEEIEARMKRKFDAIVKRERAMAYAYSHQLWKSTPQMGQGAIMDFRSGGYPYWWNWFEQPPVPPPITPTNHLQTPAINNFHSTPTRPTMDFKASPLPHSSNIILGFDNMDTPTPRSTRSSLAPRTRQARSQTPPSRPQQKFPRGSAAMASPFNGAAFKDDDSLTSCPPFSVPRYMVPTVSAKAKLKGGKEQFPDSLSSTTDDPKRRVSFPLGQGKWTKGSFFSNKKASSPSVLGKQQSLQSVGSLSVDSTVSMPATVGRKPFNRFV